VCACLGGTDATVVMMLLLSYCCYTVVTLLLHCGHTFATLLLHSNHTVLTLLLHCVTLQVVPMLLELHTLEEEERVAQVGKNEMISF
jgi:hypothetical protein